MTVSAQHTQAPTSTVKRLPIFLSIELKLVHAMAWAVAHVVSQKKFANVNELLPTYFQTQEFWIFAEKNENEITQTKDNYKSTFLFPLFSRTLSS